MAAQARDLTEPGPLEVRLKDFLGKRQPPKTFCPSEVARALTADELRDQGFDSWRDATPAVRELAWRWREQGEGVEILQKGQVMSAEVGLNDVSGPIRLRRVDG